MKKKTWVPIVAFIVLLIAIFYGGPMLSKYYDKKYRATIDKAGIILKAVVYDRKTYKGKTVHFSYLFDGMKYSNNEQSDCLFHTLNVGDTILIKVDSTHPPNSYIIQPKCQQE